MYYVTELEVGLCIDCNIISNKTNSSKWYQQIPEWEKILISVHSSLLSLGPISNFITVRNSSCGKVMFSQVVSVHSGEVYPLLPGRHPPGRHMCRHPSPGRHMGKHPLPCRHPPGYTPLPGMATAADGKHHTGMHSCFSVMILTFTNECYTCFTVPQCSFRASFHQITDSNFRNFAWNEHPLKTSNFLCIFWLL